MTRTSRGFALLAAAAVVAALAPAAVAAGGAGTPRLARVAKLAAEVDERPAPERYAALRRLFDEWDTGDPAEVLEAVRGVAADRAQPAPIRAYARLLESYAERRLGDVAGAKAIVASLGFVRSWMVVGPFDNEGKTGLGRAYEPEIDESPAPGRAYDGKERKVAWRVAPLDAPFGWIDTGALVRPTPNVCAYAATHVRDRALGKGQSRTLSIFAGSAGAIRVTFDGTVALEDGKYRSFDADRLAANVTLRDGWARVVVKVCGDETPPIFALRVGDASGAPIALDVVASPPQGTGARKALPLPAQTVAGPLSALERAAKGGGAAAEEALARYLVDTHSDDPAEHRARDLAARAADAAPTIRRLLLAADLAENRNQAEGRIERAEALAKKASADERVLVLLARAAHARSSPNWRDAVPFYDAALALDPDDAAAVLARVDLYQEANLHQTAIAALERAVTRRPRSALLLRALSVALRHEDRTTEADEIDERVAQVRFDEGAWVKQRLDLALARRDREAAVRWLERGLSLDPDGADRIATAARVYVRLGDRPRAVALYKRALDLAPEDTDTLRALAEVYALGGQQSEEVALLRKVLELRPQATDVREHLAHLEPQGARPDEAYARPPTEFLAPRGKPAGGLARRTLVSLTVATVFQNGLSSKFNQVVYQPLTERAAQEDRTYSFGYEADSQIVQVRGARVFHADGTVEDATEMGESGNADSPEIAMYTSTRVYSIRMPRLSAGDVVELRWRVEDVSAHNAFADYFGDVSYLEGRDPIGRAEYVLIGPKARTFYFNAPSIPVAKTVEEKGASRVYRWVATDVAGVEPEALQPPYTELLAHVHVSTYKSWEDVGRWYWGLVKDQFNADDQVRQRVRELTRGAADERAKVRAIYDWVVQRTRYVALEFGIHGFKPYSCPQIFARGFGDCKDKATLIVTMLKEAGVPATIVIVRTGLRGLFDESPASLAPFDHAIAYVPSLDLYLDGTAEYTGSTELPAMDRGAMALQINEGHAKLVRLPDAEAKESASVRRIDAQLAADGSATVDWRAEVTGASAAAWRVRYHAEASRKQRLEEDLGSDLPNVAVGKVDAPKLDDVEAPVSIRARGKVAALARAEDGGLSVAAGPREHMVREYAPLSQRKLDVRLGPRNVQTTEWTLRLPPGAKVTSAPRPAHGSSPFGSYDVAVEGTGPVIKVTTTIALDRSRVPAAEYGALRAFCEAADRALGQRVVLSK